MAQSILLIQDSAPKAANVRTVLSNSSGRPYFVEWARSCSAGLARLNNTAVEDIAGVVMDLFLPDSQGLEAFDRVIAASPHVPILVVSSPEREELAQQAVQRGAQDYVFDDHLDGHLLLKAIRNMLERAANAEALFIEKERAQITLNSIGDAVISTDVAGHVTYLNKVAEAMTGWSAAEALGQVFTNVFQIIDGANPAFTANPMTDAMHQNKTVGLPANCILVRRDGVESAIEDSTAPIHDRRGRVKGAVIVFHDVTQSRAISDKLSYLAHHDFLTDLPNRLLLDDRLSQAMAAALRYQHQLAVLFVDVDRFKHINDSLGHAIGDELLQSIARRLVDNVRHSDTVIRQGGDEFVILLSSVTHSEDAALSATKVLTALSMPHRVKEHDLLITASIGIGVYPGDGLDPHALVKSADLAMLHAKDNGRNNYQFFRSDMNENAIERQSLESGLRHALARREFELYYQPKVDLKTETITGAEALIRWRHPERGMVLPDRFIPIAEQCGYIVPIGRWVLQEACRQTQCWLNAHLAAVPVAINISAVELRSKDFVHGVRAILEETGLDPQYLELELTETALMQEPNSTITVLQALKELGVRLALDDFGTDYSSLSYLKRFPIDTLKIDKLFVHGLCTDSGDASIVDAVISMGKSFHLRVVAEGVETQEQLLVLQAQCCAEVQGYYFHRPLPAPEFAKLLSTGSSIAIVA